MIEINGKKYKVNLDIKWGTRKFLRKIQKDPDNPDNDQFLELIVKDILIPKPTVKQLGEFRNSDIKRIFDTFAKLMMETDTEFKKKLG